MSWLVLTLLAKSAVKIEFLSNESEAVVETSSWKEFSGAATSFRVSSVEAGMQKPSPGKNCAAAKILLKPWQIPPDKCKYSG